MTLPCYRPGRPVLLLVGAADSAADTHQQEADGTCEHMRICLHKSMYKSANRAATVNGHLHGCLLGCTDNLR